MVPPRVSRPIGAPAKISRHCCRMDSPSLGVTQLDSVFGLRPEPLPGGLLAAETCAPRLSPVAPASGEKRRQFFGTMVARAPCTRYWGSDPVGAIPLPGANSTFSASCGAICRQTRFPVRLSAPRSQRVKSRGSRDRRSALAARPSPGAPHPDRSVASGGRRNGFDRTGHSAFSFRLR